VEERGERLKITAMGGIETEVGAADVVKRERVTRAAFQDKVRARLKEKEERAKDDDALGHFRLAWFCWTYGLEADAVPHLQKTVDDAAFPAVARVFGGDKGAAIADAWYAYSGKPVAVAVAARPAAPKASSSEASRPSAAPAPPTSASPDDAP